MSSSANVVLGGFTVRHRVDGSIGQTAIRTSTDGTVVIRDCLVSTGTENASGNDLAGIALSRAAAGGCSQYVLGCDINAGYSSSGLFGVQTRGLSIGASQASSRFFVHGCDIDGGKAERVAGGAGGATTSGVMLTGTLSVVLAGTVIWGGVCQRMNADTAYSYGILASGVQGNVLFASNLVCGGRAVAASGASAYAYGLYLSSPSNTGIGVCNTVLSGSTNGTWGQGPYVAYYSIAATGSRAWAGNITVAWNDGAASCGLLNQDNMSAFLPLEANASFGFTSVYQVSGGTANAFGCWLPSRAFANYTDGVYTSRAAWVPENFRLAAGNPDSLASPSFLGSAIPDCFTWAATNIGFQYACHDVAGRERATSGSWSPGAFR